MRHDCCLSSAGAERGRPVQAPASCLQQRQRSRAHRSDRERARQARDVVGRGRARNARAAVVKLHREMDFTPQEVFARLDIKADIANYRRLEA